MPLRSIKKNRRSGKGNNMAGRLNGVDLFNLIQHECIVDALEDNVKGASIDVRLGRYILCEDLGNPVVIDLAARQPIPTISVDLRNGPYVLEPGDFVLAQTIESFNLPLDVAAEFRLKSTIGRSGLDQAQAVWCDPGWHGSVLTLEIKNNWKRHSLILSEGLPIGQMIFEQLENPVPSEWSYAKRGRYNNDMTVKGPKK